MLHISAMFAIWATTLARAEPQPPIKTPTETSSPTLTSPEATDPIVSNTTTEGFRGWDYLTMIGGTELADIVYPQAVPIKQSGQMTNGDDNFDCFGVIGGNNSRTKRMLYTSGFCQVKGMIRFAYGSDGVYDINLEHPLAGSARQKRQTVRKTRPFSIDLWTYAYLDSLNDSYFAGELITDKERFQDIYRVFNDTPAIVLGSTPYKAAAVSLNQANCTFWYQNVGLASWPDDLPKGVFCIFHGTSEITAHVVNGHQRQIQPGLPCKDSLGSPVLIGDNFTQVLGLVVEAMCNDWTPPEFNIPKFALAVSFAHGLDWEVLVPPTNRSFGNFTTRALKYFRTDSTPGTVIPRGGVSRTLFSSVLLPCTAIIWGYMVGYSWWQQFICSDALTVLTYPP